MNNNKIDKKIINSIIFFLIIIIAIILRARLFLQEGFITTDGFYYITAGKNLLETGKFEVFGSPHLIFPPGYPFLIGITNLFFDNLIFSARLVSLVSGIFIVYLFYLIGKKIHTAETGLFASFFAATSLYLIIFSQITMTESVFVFFMMLIFYYYLNLNEKYNIKNSIIIGSLIGFSYLIRPEGIMLLFLVPVLCFKKRKKINIKKSLAKSFLIIFSAFIVMSPYLFFLYQNTGKITLTPKTSYNLVPGLIGEKGYSDNMVGNNYSLYEKTISNYDENANSVKLPEKFRNISLKKVIFNEPFLFINRYIRNFILEVNVLLSDYYIFLLLMPILFITVYSYKRKSYRENVFILYFISFMYLLLLPIFHIESRYLILIFPFVVLLASLGYSIRDKFTVLKYKKFNFYGSNLLTAIRITVLMFIFIKFIVIANYVFSYDYKINHIESKIAAEELKKEKDFNPKKSVIMSRKPFVAFYSGSEKGWVSMPYTSADNVIKFAKSRNVNYIIIDQRYVGIRDNYEELKNLNDYSDKVKLIFKDDSVKQIKIFKLIK